MNGSGPVEALYRELLDAWNQKDAARYADCFSENGSMVGFDGSCIESSASIAEHLGSIFADHTPATYVSKVLEIRALGTDTTLLRAAVGMVPPGNTDIDPSKNAIQALVAVNGAPGWRITHFQNTPAAFDGRPEAAESLTAELRAQL
jgi:uncharacterized protein (TIGR02246 family)